MPKPFTKLLAEAVLLITPPDMLLIVEIEFKDIKAHFSLPIIIDGASITTIVFEVKNNGPCELTEVPIAEVKVIFPLEKTEKSNEIQPNVSELIIELVEFILMLSVPLISKIDA